jgi:triacylglycerol lipase
MIKTISKAINLAALAYQHPCDIESALVGEFESFKWVENRGTDTQAFICSDDEAAWVSFRGTEFEGSDKLKDLETDLKFNLVPGHYGKEHRGFMEATLSVYDQIMSLMVKYRLRNLPVYVCGHSLGAGIGESFCARALSYNNSVSKLITMGGPRTMNDAAAEIFGELWGHNIYAVVNNNDIVTRIPPRLFGYSHVKNRNLYYLTEDGKLSIDPGRWSLFLDRIKGAAYDFGEAGMDCIKDHPISEYRRIWKDLK